MIATLWQRIHVPSSEEILNARNDEQQRALKGLGKADQLMTVVAMERPRGRPSNKGKERVSAWGPATTL